MNILTPASDVTSRGKKVRDILKPLVEKPNSLYVIPKSQPGEFIFSVHSIGFSSAKNYTEMRFRTIVPAFLGMYYEIWHRKFDGKKEFYYLYRAYLHLYHIDSVKGEIEFLLLHCDPNEPASAPHAKYKQSLHLHIECVDAAWPHSIWPHTHIGLNVAYLNLMLKDVNSFTQAIEMAALMLKEQVLEALL